ncbi:salicylate hydroxylase [Bradyrhizobium macuxiense]|uniref:Salicylate hydroxylase n=1 Tax=Bradyrhizobium macuxiense TaxID=1755647 RepID=A0A560KX75_9BRAD|nr:alpha/beta hydrolase fold domain-containing protein [Bradyrhizobium macuxiense]TWB87825.1 salicylate hydroxylase [Bradyrhizobium macuxiense]
MHALIAGAGCGGLAAAIALHREGYSVTVVERAPALTEVGAGVVMGPHAMRVLDHLGAADHVRKLNTAPEIGTYFDLASGELRVRTALGDAGKQLYGEKLYSTHRRDLIDALVGKLGGVEVRLNSTIVNLEQDAQGATLVLASGERIRGDFVVGADGLRSTVRTVLFGESPAVFTGFLAWRTIMPIEVLGYSLPPQTKLWAGTGRHVVHYPIRHGRQFYAAFYVPADQIHREDWSVSGDVDDLRASFADACIEVRHLTNTITEAFITGIYYRDPLPKWHKGRIVLLGDAAHPVLPTSGSGAAVALEDSVALAACLRRHQSDLAAAFGEFEARRKPRTTQLLISSRADLTTYHEDDPVKIAARGPMNRAIMQLDPTGVQRLSWLYSYNEVEESRKTFEQFSRRTVARPQRPEAQRAFDFWASAVRAEDGVGGWTSEREAYNRALVTAFQAPADVFAEVVDCGGLPALRVTPPGGAKGPAVLHLHGGGFMYGSAASSIQLAAEMARSIGGWALVPDFRVAPEYRAEDMQADVRTARDWIVKRNNTFFVSAEGSGASLALSLALSLRDADTVSALALYLLSPFVDPSLSGSSIDTNSGTEACHTRLRLLRSAAAYVQDHHVSHPIVAPLKASLHGLPPMHIAAAQDEALVDDARRLAQGAGSAGVEVRLTLVPDSVHAFAHFVDLPEARQYFSEVGQDARRRMKDLARP